jgi:pyridoxal 5'-phosphate synthase pdxT subunit
MYSDLTVGVLALQGDYERHRHRLISLKANTCEVRVKEDLDGLDGLIIPGGESTTMSLLIDRFGLRDRLVEFCRKKGVWGTCAGMILLAREIDDARISPLEIIDITVRRNAYGRQVHSFHTYINADLNGVPAALQASFIRAPMVSHCGPDVQVIAKHEESPVLLSQRNCLVSSFHTELDDDLTLTQYFLKNFVSLYK